jgi:predicted ATPase
LNALLGEDPALAHLKELLVKRGNRFFLEETIWRLVETEALAAECGRYRLTKPLDATQIPATVQPVLTARIEQLLECYVARGYLGIVG